MTTLTDARPNTPTWGRSFEEEGAFILDVDHDGRAVKVAYNFPLEPLFAARWYAQMGREAESLLWEAFHNDFDADGDEDLTAALDGCYVIDIVRVGRTDVERLN